MNQLLQAIAFRALVAHYRFTTWLHFLGKRKL